MPDGVNNKEAQQGPKISFSTILATQQGDQPTLWLLHTHTHIAMAKHKNQNGLSTDP